MPPGPTGMGESETSSALVLPQGLNGSASPWAGAANTTKTVTTNNVRDEVWIRSVTSRGSYSGTRSGSMIVEVNVRSAPPDHDTADGDLPLGAPDVRVAGPPQDRGHGPGVVRAHFDHQPPAVAEPGPALLRRLPHDAHPGGGPIGQRLHRLERLDLVREDPHLHGAHVRGVDADHVDLAAHRAGQCREQVALDETHV